MQKTGVLFVVRSFSRTGALPVRFRQIAGCLATHFDVHILELTYRKEEARTVNGVRIHSLEYSQAGRIFNPERSWSVIRTAGVSHSGKPLAVLKRHIRSLLFPDSVITEVRRLRKEVSRISLEEGIRVVVLSAFPFSVLLCARSLKKKIAARIILDVGDPFYRNSTNGRVRDWLARRFEKKHLKYIDRLVVSSEAIRNHYLGSYPFLTPAAVHTVAMGITGSLLQKSNTAGEISPQNKPSGQLRLVYAGQLYRKMREPFELYRAVIQMNQVEGQKAVLELYGSFSREFSAGYENADAIRFMGPVEHDTIDMVYGNADVVVFIDNAYGLQTPGKIFEVAFLKRPVLFIADRVQSPALDFIRDMKHITVVRNRADLIGEAIRTITGRKPEYPSSESVREFLWENRAEEYRQIINCLASE